MSPRRHTVLLGAQIGGLLIVFAVAAATSSAEDWRPVWLVLGLLLFGSLSDLLALRLRGVEITGAFSALVLAMVLLGPGPAVMIGVVTTLLARREGQEVRYTVSTLFTWTAFPLIGSLAFQALETEMVTDVELLGLVFGIYMLSNLLNFTLIYGYCALADGNKFFRGFKDVYAQLVPIDIATGLLVVGVVWADIEIGETAIGLVAVVILVFQYMLRTALQAIERGEQLEERNRELASLQFGLITVTMKTLALRDNMTARHSAAVARYSREMARELGLPSDEQELIHTAGLFHDIGKFIFPDSILLADRPLSDADYEIVRRHPEVGADLIAEIEGYAPVAAIVRHHHERIDGLGYPSRIEGVDIPLGSRILAVADVYDVITSRDTYRTPVTTQEAFAELRRVAGTQLDPELVDLFIKMVQSRGIVFRHSSADDFEAELALERRVSDYARPRQTA